MGRKVPRSEIPPPGSVLQGGMYLLEGMEHEAVETRTGKLMYKCRSVVIEPEDEEGESFFAQYVCGSDEDPMAEEVKTWKTVFGAKLYNAMLGAAGISLDIEDDEEIAAAFKGQRYLASIIKKTQPMNNPDGTPNAYAGNEQNEAKKYFAVGEREPGYIANGAPPSRPAAAVAQPAKKTRAAAPPPRNEPVKTAASASGRVIDCSICKEKNIPVLQVGEHMRTRHADDQE